VSRVQYGVRLVAESAVTGLGPDGIFVLQVNRSTRDGPGNVFNSFGVPFSNTYRLMVPSSVAVNGSSVEFHVFDLGLWVYAEGLAVSLFSGNAGSLPLTAVPSFQIDPNAPLALPQHANQVQSVPIDSLVTLVILGLLIVASAFNKIGRGWY